LSVVKISPDRTNVYVFSFLRRHLQFLSFADSVFWVKNGYFCSVDVFVSFKRRFSGVSGCGDKDKSVSFFPGFVKSEREQSGHNLQSHILESAGWPVPEFKDFLLFVKRFYRRRVRPETRF